MLKGNVHIPDTLTGSPLGPMQFIEHITTRGNNLFIANERFIIRPSMHSQMHGFGLAGTSAILHMLIFTFHEEVELNENATMTGNICC